MIVRLQIGRLHSLGHEIAQGMKRSLNSAIPKIQQPAVHPKVTTFWHSKLGAAQILKCVVSFERGFQASIWELSCHQVTMTRDVYTAILIGTP